MRISPQLSRFQTDILPTVEDDRRSTSFHLPMPKTLAEYVQWLDERNTLWPKVPPAEPAKATPFVKPLAGIRAVSWSVYGTLLRISDGEWLPEHPQELRMQVALEKTIREFNMWYSMTRKPEEPWRQMQREYRQLLEEQQMTGSRRRGEVPETDSRLIWRKIVGRLQAKDYEYDRSLYGDEDQLSEKIAYFFHASLQGTEAPAKGLSTLHRLAGAGLTQALLGRGQCFTLVQLLRALRAQGMPPAPGDLFALDCSVLSFQAGVRPPSPNLYRQALQRFAQKGIEPGEILYVSSRLRDELAVAKSLGMRTALYAGDRLSLRATAEEVRDPQFRPDRLLTDLSQLGEILSL